MKVSMTHGLAAVALAMLVVAPVAAGTATCALPLDCVSRNPPQPGAGQPACGPACGTSKNVWHGQWNACGGFGGFDLTGTQYELACGISGTVACPTANVPPIRFWDFDNGWATGNSGCQRTDDPAASWMANKGVDDGLAGANGYWYLYQANWAGPAIDKCGAVSRTIADITFTNQANEGSVNHSSWFLVASVAEAPVGQFDFDNVTGGTNCGTTANNSIVPKAAVPGLTIAGKATACTGGAAPVTGATNTVDGNYFDIDVTLVNPNPTSYRDAGGAELIAGYQIVYATGAEPTTSSWTSGVWQPVRDRANPSQGAGVILRGTTAATTVTLPKGANVWLATRIIYVDATENPLTPFASPGPPTTSVAGPILGTHVSGHCGPVVGGTGTTLSCEFASLEAKREANGNVRIKWSTANEDDTTHFSVIRSTSASGTEGVVEAVPYVEAQGPYRPYEAVDTLAVDTQGTLYYFVQEWTSSGPGTRSASLKVEGTGSQASDPAVLAPGSSGGRRRH